MPLKCQPIPPIPIHHIYLTYNLTLQIRMYIVVKSVTYLTLLLKSQ